jgi:hypothetical protein
MPAEFVRLTTALLDVTIALERENEVLRELLRRQGLSDATIRRKVAAYLKENRDRETARQLLKTVCEEILKRLPALDAEEKLAALPIKGRQN